MKTDLIDKLSSKKAVIGVLGLGYVGLPLVLAYSRSGFKVVGLDIDKSKVDRLNNGESYIKHIDDDSIASCVTQGFYATTEFSKIKSLDAVIICVPTPITKNREPDTSYINSTVDQMLPYLKKGHVISLESTTYPGTTEELLVAKFQEQGFSVGEDIFVIYSPEREDPGQGKFKLSSIPKVCGGYTQSCLEVGEHLYQSVVTEVVKVSSTRVAEMTKVLENIHRAVNIGLVNELKIVADKMNIDIYEVINAAATKPFGFVPYFPGPGLGGHCIPVDPFYLTWKAREYGVNTKFIELAGEVNGQMPRYVVDKCILALNNAFSKSLRESKVLLLGMAYKKNVDDIRESPSLEILTTLLEFGAEVKYNDPYVKKLHKMRKYEYSLESQELTSELLRDQDLVVLVTDHDIYDYDLIRDNSKLIIDTRGRFSCDGEKIYLA